MLSRMAAQFCGKELLLLTERETTEKVCHVERSHDLRGWWAKLELFSPSFRVYRPCIFFDLDTYILSDVRELLSEPDELWLIRDFYQTSRSNSGVMLIPEDTDEIWEKAQNWPHFNNPTMGDGDFLTTMPHQRINDRFDGLTSYKIHCQKHPAGKICCFHGKPKPHQADGWAGELWQAWTR